MLADSRSDPEFDVLKGLEDVAKKYTKLLSREEEQILITQYKTNKAHSQDNKAALDKLIKHNLRLIFKFAKKVSNEMKGTLTTYDLIMAGVQGLIHALDKYDQTRLTDKGIPMKLSTYATWWIKQYIQRSCQDFSRSVRIPIHMHDLLQKICKAHGEYCSTHPDSLGPTPLILSLKTGIPIEQVKTLGTYKFPIGSIDEKQNEEEDSLTVAAYLEAPSSHNADAGAEARSNREELIRLLRQLPEEDWIFMSLRLGLVDGIDRNEKEMALVLKCKPKDVLATERRITEHLKTIAERSRFSL